MRGFLIIMGWGWLPQGLLDYNWGGAGCLSRKWKKGLLDYNGVGLVASVVSGRRRGCLIIMGWGWLPQS